MTTLSGEQAMREKLVIIGNGMAPGRVLDELFDSGIDHYDITIFNAEARVNYDRILLSPVLSGEKRYEDIVIHDEAWYASHGITLRKGMPVIDIHRDTKTVTAMDGSSVRYDTLLIATGSRPIVPPLPGHDLAGVVTYRDLDDVQAIMSRTRQQVNDLIICRRF